MPTDEELKEQQRRQWSSNASNWNSQHERLEREMAPVSQWLCREAGIGPGMRVLDLACGSGHPAIDIGRLVGPGGSVVASDFAPEMVENTRQRVSEAGLANVEAEVIDMEQIAYPESSFNAVTCRFGVMFCPRPESAVAEVWRVLKTGGRFALAVWDQPQRSPAQTILGDALRQIGHEIQPADYSLPGVYQLAPPGKLAALLEDAGFASVRTESLPLSMEYESVDALWERRLAAPAALKPILDTMSPAEMDELKRAFAEVARPYVRDDAIRLAQTPLCAVATK